MELDILNNVFVLLNQIEFENVTPVVTFLTSLFHDDLVKTIHNYTFDIVTVIIMKNHENTRNTVN